MTSRQNTSDSVISFIERIILLEGYSLKKYSLKKWIYENGYTQPYVARKLGLHPEDFKQKLRASMTTACHSTRPLTQQLTSRYLPTNGLQAGWASCTFTRWPTGSAISEWTGTTF